MYVLARLLQLGCLLNTNHFTKHSAFFLSIGTYWFQITFKTPQLRSAALKWSDEKLKYDRGGIETDVIHGYPCRINRDGNGQKYFHWAFNSPMLSLILFINETQNLKGDYLKGTQYLFTRPVYIIYE